MMVHCFLSVFAPLFQKRLFAISGTGVLWITTVSHVRNYTFVNVESMDWCSEETREL